MRDTKNDLKIIMDERINTWLSLIFNFGVILLAFFTPLLFWNLTSEFYETPKFLLVALLIGFLLILGVIRGIIRGKLSLAQTPLNLPLALLLAVFGLSAFFAPAKSAAIFGNLPRIHGSLTAFGLYIILYFVLVSNLVAGTSLHLRLSATKQIIYAFLASGIILSILGLISYAGINLFSFPWTAGLNFTPTGSSFSTAAFLVLLLPFLLTTIFQNSEKEILGDINNEVQGISQALGIRGHLGGKAILSLVLTLFASVIVLTGSLAIYVAALAVVALILFINPPTLVKKNLPFLVIPLVATLTLAFLSFVPLKQSQNIFFTQAQKFPREIQLPFQTSWKISISAFRDSPFWGSGPASYLANFTTYKPVEFNTSKFWNIRFDQAFNEYFYVLGTLGALGLIALMFLTAAFISSATKLLSSPNSIQAALAISGLTFFLLLALHSSTLPLWIAGIIVLAMFMAIHKNDIPEAQLKLGTPPQTSQLSSYFTFLPIITLAIAILAVTAAFYFTGKFALADYHHREALNAVAANKGLDAYNELVKAERLNPYADLYRNDLAQTNFALANAIAKAKGPTEASPGGSLTDQDKQNIQTLLSQAINEGKAATAINPQNPANWEILGSIYRQISGVAQNALAFALDAYGRAIQRDPLNPTLRLTVGGIYYSAKNYDMAVRFFSDAISLKPDYANAYYNLAIVLKDKGDLISAASAAERTVSLLDPQSPDYKVASDLLANLKNQIASKTADEQTQQAVPETGKTLSPPTQTKSALQEKSLPQVLDLPEPENIATPPAVQKPKPSE